MFPPNTKILIADDMPSLRDLLKAYLRRIGFTNIVQAKDGREAFETLREAQTTAHPIELVISDWNMPILDGLELLKLVRSSPEWKQLPFLLLTTESEKGKVLEAVLAQVSNYIVKPVEEDVLREKLAKVWEKSNAAKAAS